MNPSKMQYLQQQDFTNEYDMSQAKYLGGGTFGKVYSALSKKDNQVWAVKIIECPDEQSQKLAESEFNIYKMIDQHPNIILVKDLYIWQEFQPMPKFILAMIMELGETSLMHLIMKNRNSKTPFQEQFLLTMMKETIETFHYLILRKNVYHRDIKPENMLLKNDKIKLTDFGLSKQLHEQKIMKSMNNTLVGTPVYLSPLLWDAFLQRQMNNVQHDLEKSDVFSLGITFLQTTLLLDNEISGLNTKEGQNNLMNLLRNITNFKIRDLITKMLQYQEAKRPTYQDLLQEFFPFTAQIQLVQGNNNQQQALKQGIQTNQKAMIQEIKFLQLLSRSKAPYVLTLIGCCSIQGKNIFVITGLNRQLRKKVVLPNTNSEEQPSVDVDVNTTIRSICPVPDLDAIAGGGDNGIIQIWDFNSLQIRMMLQGHVKTISDLVPINGKNRLVSSSWDKKIIMWNLQNGQQIQQFSMHTSFVMSLLYFEGQDTLISCSIDRSIILVYNLQLPPPSQQSDAQPNPPSQIQTQNVFIEKGAHEQGISSLAKLRNKQFCSGSKSGEIKIWEMKGQGVTMIMKLQKHTKSVEGLIFLDSYDLLISSGMDGLIYLWNISTGVCIAQSYRDEQKTPISSILAYVPNMPYFFCCDGYEIYKYKLEDSFKQKKQQAKSQHKSSGCKCNIF